MRILKLTLLFFALLPGLVSHAKDPRIGLVLGGGGAKGAGLQIHHHDVQRGQRD